MIGTKQDIIHYSLFINSCIRISIVLYVHKIIFVLTWQPVAVITIPICLQILETWIFSYALILTGSQSFSYQCANMGWGVRRRFSWLILFAWRRCRLCSPVTMSASSGGVSPWHHADPNVGHFPKHRIFPRRAASTWILARGNFHQSCWYLCVSFKNHSRLGIWLLSYQ